MTSFTARYKFLTFNKANLMVLVVGGAVILAMYFFGISSLPRAGFLFVMFVLFLIINQAILAKFLPEDKFHLFAEETKGIVFQMPQLGRILHYLLIGLLFSLAFGARGPNPDAVFTGFSTTGLLYAAVYGLFNEFNLKRQNQNKQDDDK